MNILYLAHRIPYPPNKGEKIRMYNQIKYLSEFGDIYLIALVDDPADFVHHSALKKLCREVHLFPVNKILKKILTFKELFSNKPLTTGYFYKNEVQETFNNLLAKYEFKTIISFSVQMAEYMFRAQLTGKKNHPNKEIFKKTSIIMDFCDVDSAKWHAYGKISKWPLSAIYLREAKLLSNYEHRTAEFVDISIFASIREKQYFQKQHPDLKSIIEITNGVDLDFFNPKAKCKSIQSPFSTVLVFTGAMDYYANADGAIWFIEKILPEIRKQFPDTAFYMAGSTPGKELKRLANNKDILLTGFVEDIRPYYNLATICIIPLRVARGIQNKILEAMAMARPVVTTKIAFEGISAKPGKDLLVSENEKGFAEAVISLIKNKEYRKKIANNGRSAAENNYNWEINLSPLKKICTNPISANVNNET
jgi:polysaccharide biosynthesis protein PslH